ncbi:MAG TPA: DNA-binding protein WhiA [Clostridiaceae bacterium]|nr:DNA-binding protein WhiA [Clostridiaceae bacterium]
MSKINNRSNAKVPKLTSDAQKSGTLNVRNKSDVQKIIDRPDESNRSFSAQLRESILGSIEQDVNYLRIGFVAFCSVSFKSLKKRLRLATRSENLINYFRRVLRIEYQTEPKIVYHKELITCTVNDQVIISDIADDVDQLFHQNPASLSEQYSVEDYYMLIRAILRGLYLGCGFLANPQERYHLEFNIPKRSTSLWYGLFLSELNLEPGRTVHQGSEVLYLKEGELIADFLRYVGADQYLIKFEEVRVEKDMRNHVNRIVNCDNANAQRLANSVARQIYNINFLIEKKGLASLPDDLREAAELRLKYPDYSLRELGEQATPPLGKSGINHRLSKLDKLADELRQNKG